MNSPLVIRKSDRAIFEPSYPDNYDYLWEPEYWVRHITLAEDSAHYYFRRLALVKRRWWFGSRLVRTGETWEPTDDSLFDVVEKRDVLKGCQML